MLKLSYTIPNNNPRLFEGIRNNEMFMEVFRSYFERENVDMLLMLEQVRRFSGPFTIYRRRNPPREQGY